MQSPEVYESEEEEEVLVGDVDLALLRHSISCGHDMAHEENLGSG